MWQEIKCCQLIRNIKLATLKFRNIHPKCLPLMSHKAMSMALKPAKNIPLRPKSSDLWYISDHKASLWRGFFSMMDGVKNSIVALITSAGPYPSPQPTMPLSVVIFTKQIVLLQYSHCEKLKGCDRFWQTIKGLTWTIFIVVFVDWQKLITKTCFSNVTVTWLPIHKSSAQNSSLKRHQIQSMEIENC